MKEVGGKKNLIHHCLILILVPIILVSYTVNVPNVQASLLQDEDPEVQCAKGIELVNIAIDT